MKAGLWSLALVRILLAQLSFGFAWCMYLVCPKFLATALGVGPAEIGAVGTAAGVASACAVVLVVRSIDVSRRSLFLRGSLLLMLASLGYTFVDRFGPLVYVLQACVAISYGMAFNAGMASVTDVVPPSRLGQAFGLQSAANLSMNAVSTMAAERIAQHHGWRWVFLTAAGAALVSCCLALFLPSVAARDAASEPAGAPPYRALSPVFLTASLLGAGYMAATTFHQPFALSLGARDVGEFFVGFTAAALTMRLGFGTLADRLGRARVAIASLLMYAAVALSMVGFDGSRLWLHGAGFGLAHGVAYPTLIAFLTEHVHPTAKGRVIAVFSGCFSFGAALSALGFGKLSASHGYPAIYFVAAGCMLVACVALASTTGAVNRLRQRVERRER